MADIIDGRIIAQESNSKVASRIKALLYPGGSSPKLVSLIAGQGSDAEIYMNMQRKVAEEVGIEFVARRLPADVSAETMAFEIEKLNFDHSVTSIIVQKPLPVGIDHDSVVDMISPEKDAEGIHPYNLGKILRKNADIVPCTPGAVMKVIRSTGVDLYGKEVVVIGHSAIVGKPLSVMMLNENATTTVCHIATSEKGDLVEHVKKADVLVVAVGCEGLVPGDWIKEGAIVVDVGINSTEDGIKGDVNFEEARLKASAITPVPGGVGPVTVSILMRNVLRAYQKCVVPVKRS